MDGPALRVLRNDAFVDRDVERRVGYRISRKPARSVFDARDSSLGDSADDQSLEVESEPKLDLVGAFYTRDLRGREKLVPKIDCRSQA